MMIDLAENGRHKVYALDFWGFGDSGKTNTPPFRVDSYTQMVNQFMEILGIERAPILGHSMGGTVALSFALAHPQRATKVGVVGSPIEGKSLNFFLRFAGRDWVQLAQSLPTATHMIVNTLVRINTARDKQRVRKMLLTMWIRPAWNRFSAASAIYAGPISLQIWGHWPCRFSASTANMTTSSIHARWNCWRSMCQTRAR